MVHRSKNIVNGIKKSPICPCNVRALRAMCVLCPHCAQTPGGLVSGEKEGLEGLWEELGLQPMNSDELTGDASGGREDSDSECSSGKEARFCIFF